MQVVCLIITRLKINIKQGTVDKLLIELCRLYCRNSQPKRQHTQPVVKTKFKLYRRGNHLTTLMALVLMYFPFSTSVALFGNLMSIWTQKNIKKSLFNGFHSSVVSLCSKIIQIRRPPSSRFSFMIRLFLVKYSLFSERRKIMSKPQMKRRNKTFMNAEKRERKIRDSR